MFNLADLGIVPDHRQILGLHLAVRALKECDNYFDSVFVHRSQRVMDIFQSSYKQAFLDDNYAQNLLGFVLAFRTSFISHPNLAPRCIARTVSNLVIFVPSALYLTSTAMNP